MRAAAVIGVCCLCGCATTTPAQSAVSNPSPVAAYTAEQATLGEQLFRRSCNECHETLEYTGPEFRAKWNNRPAFELFDLIRSTMPEEAPASLTRAQYADVVAYMLKLNAVLAGAASLPTADDDLKKVRIEIPATARR